MANSTVTQRDPIEAHATLGNCLSLVLFALRNGDTARATEKAAQAVAAYRALTALEVLA